MLDPRQLVRFGCNQPLGQGVRLFVDEVAVHEVEGLGWNGRLLSLAPWYIGIRPVKEGEIGVAFQALLHEINRPLVCGVVRIERCVL